MLLLVKFAVEAEVKPDDLALLPTTGGIVRLFRELGNERSLLLLWSFVVVVVVTKRRSIASPASSSHRVSGRVNVSN